MTTTTTIRRNAHKRIAAFRNFYAHCRCYSLGSDFIGLEVDPEMAWTAYEKFDFARLTVTGGTATIHVHSNRWFELTR